MTSRHQQFTQRAFADRATKKQGGSTKNSKDSHPKFLGVKKFGSEWVIPGNIIIRQRGTQYHPGNWVGMVCGPRIESFIAWQKFSYFCCCQLLASVI